VEIPTDKDVDAGIHLILVSWEDFSEPLIQKAEEFDANHRLLINNVLAMFEESLQRTCWNIKY
jgi:hypothetical protein